MTHRMRQRPIVHLWPDGQSSDAIDISPWVMAFTTSKTMDQPVGTWQVHLQPRVRDDIQQARTRELPDLYRLVKPNGIITIGMEYAGGIMMGLVNTIGRSRSTLGQVKSAVTLSGYDMGKTLHLDAVVKASLTVEQWTQFKSQLTPVVGPDHPILQNLPGVWGPTSPRDGAPTFKGKSLEDVIAWIIEAAPSMQIPLLKALGGSGKPGEFIDTTSSVTTWNASRIFSDTPKDFQGSVWSFLRSVLDEDVYEMWLDTVPSFFGPVRQPIPKTKLIIRPKPFDEPRLQFMPTTEQTGTGWKELKTLITGETQHVLEEDDVWDEILHHGDADAYAYYLVTSQHEVLGNARLLSEGLMFPLVDTYALPRTGLRTYEANLSLIYGDRARVQDNDTTYDTVIGNEVVEFRNRLFNWYRMLPFFEKGQIVTRGRDDFRVGDPVFLPHLQPAYGANEIGTRFYTTGVQHSWQSRGRYTCTLEVCRGHNDSTIIEAQRLIRLAGISDGVPNIDHVAEASR